MTKNWKKIHVEIGHRFLTFFLFSKVLWFHTFQYFLRVIRFLFFQTFMLVSHFYHSVVQGVVFRVLSGCRIYQYLLQKACTKQLINVTKKTNCRNCMKFKRFGLGFEIVYTTEHVCLNHFRILQAFSQQTLLLGNCVCKQCWKDTNSSKTSALKAFCWRHMNSFTYAITKPRKFQSYWSA